MISVGLRNLTKIFGDVVAVDDLTLDIPEGNLVALLGPSGCGKTTTLKMISGLIEPTDGDILFDGKSVLDIPAEKRNIGMVFQRYVLFPHMNVFDNIAFGLKMRKIPKKEIQKRVDEVINLVQLTGLEKRHPSQLSGGQQQRVAIARAVVTNPTLMLMDEPLANLDAKLRLEMREFIRDLQRRLEITTIFVTHDQSEAAVLADIVAVMFNGCIHQFDDPTHIFNHPRSYTVAEFMGSANFIKGFVKQFENGSVIVDCALGKECRINISEEFAIDKGQEILFTIRPDHIEIDYCDEMNSNAPNTFRLQRNDVIYEGGLVKYFLSNQDMGLQVHDRSTRLLTEEKELSIYLSPDLLWIIPEN
jgi:ABC-type Fe3+/spermidine/putrescine transport system ATPase subunit